MTVEGSPENTIQPPTWLDAQFLRKCLQEGLKNPELEVVSLHIKPAVGMGDNYASQMFRASLNIKNSPTSEPEGLSIVVKTLPKKGKTTEMMSDWSIFKKEAVMLTEILPKINQLLLDRYPEMEPLSAKCIWYGDDPEEVIILQDLKELGYSNTDRRSGMEYDLVKNVLTALGKFHAASYELIRTEPKQVEAYYENMWTDKYQGEMKEFFERTIQTVIDEVTTWEDMPKDYIERLKNIKSSMMQKVFDIAALRKCDINVVQHGDCWTNNFMFKRQEGQSTRVKFVDFQLSSINSAAMDLTYFIFTSPKTEFRLEKMDEMLSTYYESFSQTIDDLNIKLEKELTLDDLKKEFMRRLCFGFLSTILVFPITVLEPKKAPDINDFMDETVSMRHLYQSKAFKEGLLKVLPYFVEHGVL